MSDEGVASGSVLLAPMSATVTAVPLMGGILVSTGFWSHWLDIAIDQLEAALLARRQGLAARAMSEDVARFVLPETKASTVAAVAAAACIESFVKRVVAPSPKVIAPSRRRRSKRTGASEYNFDRLQARFEFDGQSLQSKLDRLFEERDQAIHAAEEAKPPEIHPLGVRTGSGHAHFTRERAAEAVELAIDILEGCASSVRDCAELAEVAQMLSRQAENIRRSAERARLLVGAM